jgi:CO/xanthine dehydrogenase FAD-binding subunit
LKAIDYVAPQTLSEAVGFLSAHKERARVLAGGTDLIVQIRELRRDVDLLVDVKRIPELNELRYDSRAGLYIGAAVPCYRLCEDLALRAAFPGLIDAVALVGGVQIQSRASVGGNLCNASPAADTVPALIVHKATCVITGPDGTREVPVEGFSIGPGRTALRPGELLVSLRLPPPTANTGAHYLRFIPRNEMDIAVVGAAASVTLDEAGTRCIAARIALAAVAPIPLVVPESAAALVDGSISDAMIERAARVAQEAARPISDMRGDADFRKHLVGVLTRRSIAGAIARARQAST